MNREEVQEKHLDTIASLIRGYHGFEVNPKFNGPMIDRVRRHYGVEINRVLGKMRQADFPRPSYEKLAGVFSENFIGSPGTKGKKLVLVEQPPKIISVEEAESAKKLLPYIIRIRNQFTGVKTPRVTLNDSMNQGKLEEIRRRLFA